jgi:hypothetical protein
MPKRKGKLLKKGKVHKKNVPVLSVKFSPQETKNEVLSEIIKPVPQTVEQFILAEEKSPAIEAGLQNSESAVIDTVIPPTILIQTDFPAYAPIEESYDTDAYRIIPVQESSIITEKNIGSRVVAPGNNPWKIVRYFSRIPMMYKAVALALVITIGGYGGVRYFTAPVSSDSISPDFATNEEAINLLKKVARHVLVPQNEMPMVATIANAAQLKKEQSFYENTLDGDKVVAFMSQKKVIIYSPSRDIVVNIGPILTTDSPIQKSTAIAEKVSQKTSKKK